MAGKGVPRRDRAIRERVHDPYKERRKPQEPSACPDCGSVFRGGRWTWSEAPEAFAEHRCPACQRVQDDYPAGYLTLVGEFGKQHRAELLGLARNVEEREKGEHPLKRVMQIQDQGEGILITTTDSGLARNLGDAIEAAYGGVLDYQYAKEEDLLRVTWRR